MKISLFADDSVCFVDGARDSFNTLFDILETLGRYSGCKINLDETEAIWIGSKRGCQEFPSQNKGIKWITCTSTFNSLGVKFSLNLGSIFDLNYKEKLKRMAQTVNCWRMRN